VRRWSVSIAFAAAVLATGARAEYPDHPVRLIVPQAAGSATHTVARLLAPALAEAMGQPVLVDNRPGGALTLGIELVAKAPPDGYTIGMGPVGALAITRYMVSKLP
jgi:tripartite-type tricarboxylate transporter receptor subunit TctC